LKSCKQKWEFEENKKPMRERRPVPEAPKQFEDVRDVLYHIKMIIGVKKDGLKGFDLEKYNKDAF
jgi:hypothetical protein